MEEIIINGINVAKCEFFNDYECNIYVNEYWEPQDNTKDMCKWHENCYYKQLKRIQNAMQEIKAIAERAFAVCDDDCGNANKFKEIIELTKEEEE